MVYSIIFQYARRLIDEVKMLEKSEDKNITGPKCRDGQDSLHVYIQSMIQL